MKKFKKSTVIVPALARIAVTTAASVSGTVAWFTATKNVSVTGMSFKAQSSSNLRIAKSALDATAKEAEANFKGSADFTNANVTTLNPASTVDGKNFFYTEKAKGNGSKESGNYSQATNGTNVHYYVDFVFQLKAVSTEENQKIYVDSLNLLYNGSATTTDDKIVSAQNAIRAAYFVQTQQTTGTDFSSGTGEATAIIYTTAGAENQTTNKAVKSATELDSVTYVSKKEAIANVDKTGIYYYKVVFRVWIEGEDKTCTDETYATAAANWSLTMDIRLGSENDRNTEASETGHPAITHITGITK